MKIGLFVLCYNEIAIIPFAIQYWKRFASHVHVLDNGSDDGSLEEFAKYPDWITVTHFETSDKLDDEVQKNLKNECWKKYKNDYDFVVVCDFDEFLYAPDMMKEFQWMKDNGYTLCAPTCYDMMSFKFPEYSDESLSHEIVKYGWKHDMNKKVIIIDPAYITDINYTPGAHRCSPNGIIKYCPDNHFWQFHHSDIGLEYALNKKNRRKERMSSKNLMHRWGVHYLTPDEIWKLNFRQSFKKCINVTRLY